MKTIIHLSDLHFGKVDQKRVAPLIKLINSINPDIVVVSGDITQRATEAEYKDAQIFLKKIKSKIFIIPGNHDIPLYNIFKRVKNPFKNYKELISRELSPLYSDNEVALVGINSVRKFRITSGKISANQVKRAEDFFEKMKPNIVKIVVCHHPFDIPKTLTSHHKHTHKVISGGKIAMERLAKKKVDIFLSGHLHLTHISDTTKRYKIQDYSGVIVQAGTAISTRSRSEPVAFNIIRVGFPEITIENYSGEKDNDGFFLSSTHKFKNDGSGWRNLM